MLPRVEDLIGGPDDPGEHGEAAESPPIGANEVMVIEELRQRELEAAYPRLGEDAVIDVEELERRLRDAFEELDRYFIPDEPYLFV